MRRPPPTFKYYRKTGEPDETVSGDTTVLASSRALGWDGAAAECGRSRTWEPTEVSIGGHYLAINLDSEPLPIEARDGRKCRYVTLPPDSFQITPANIPFTMRILRPSQYGAVEISLARIRRLFGCDIDIHPKLGMVDAPLTEVVRALLVEVARGGSSGQLYADGLLIAIVSRLASVAGSSSTTSAGIGALSRIRLRLAKEAIEEHIHGSLTIEELAAVVGLSPAHFAREFKRATHETPHAYVLRRRVERARQLLIAGCSIADAADRCGFSDQAHLSRAFKARFGIPPGAFARTLRR